MGTMSRFSAIHRFIDVFGAKIEGEFQHLVGATITEISDKEISYHVKANITLSKEGEFEENYEVHHRWATQEEDASGEEMFESEEDEYPMEAYFEEHLKGKVIQKIYVGTSDRDDEAYLIAVADDEGYLEIPVGFNAQCGTISGIAEEVLSEEEINHYLSA
jgi:hypothetical protein